MNQVNRWGRFSAALVAIACAGVASAAESDEFFPPEGDPLMGDYTGRWSDDVEVDPTLVAMVFPLGRDRYQLRFQAHFDMRCPPKAIIEGRAVDGVIAFDDAGYEGEVKDGVIRGKSGKSTFRLDKTVRYSPTLGAKPPAGATVLFDGTSLDAWEPAKGWEITDAGELMVTPKGGYIVSKGRYKDITLHIEFRTSLMPRARGQQRSNSGVFIQDVYEVQVLDSYGLEGYSDECGGLYKLAGPHVNACRPPLEWQTYDIDYRAPRYNAEGVLAENGRITVRHNGVLIHDDQELKWITAWTEKERLAPPPSDAGPIKMQGHNNYVQFRNIWVVEE